MIEVGLRRIDGDDRHAATADDGASLPEQLLEVDVADVPRVVVPGNDHERVAGDPVEVALGGGVLLLETERREIA